MSEKLIVSWDEYNKTVEKLAIQVYDSGYTPNLLVGIMRGGAPMIDVLSRVFKLKCAYLAVESYSGKGVEDEQGDIVFSRVFTNSFSCLNRVFFQSFHIFNFFIHSYPNSFRHKFSPF